MMQLCPKCGYERKPTDDFPDWQCPSCGVAYCKVSNIAQKPPRLSRRKSWKKPLGFMLLILIMFMAWLNHSWKTRQIKPIDTPLAITGTPKSSAATLSKDPIQAMLEGKIPSFDRNGYTLTPLASFELEAKVLSKENYWLGRPSDLSPTDLALGWGSMATAEMLDKVSITQRNRWFYWWVARDFTPELGREISNHASNMHIIPASPVVKESLDSIEKGQIVYLKGYLIEANAKDGWKWRSSLSREDTGDGACELFWVEDLKIR
jgi:hypothetical protein